MAWSQDREGGSPKLVLVWNTGRNPWYSEGIRSRSSVLEALTSFASLVAIVSRF